MNPLYSIPLESVSLLYPICSQLRSSNKYSFKNNKYDNDRSQSKYLLFSRIFVLLGESVGWIDVERVLDLVGLAAATLCIRSIK